MAGTVGWAKRSVPIKRVMMGTLRFAHPTLFLLAALQCLSVAAQTPVEKGRYLARAADCIACHTAKGGQVFTGGRAFHTPFGTVYSTNITPDKKTGIGNYSLADFTETMRNGKGLHGNLYPAMPYTSYYLVKDEDIAALYNYFMQLPAVEYPRKQNTLIFPANIRMGLSLWNWVYFDPDKPLSQGEGKSSEWQRGNYLVNALGHCGECHTPRNFAQAMQADRHFSGNILEGWDAVDIRPEELRNQGWTRQQLLQLFKTGSSERGTVFGEMSDVVQHSLSHLSDADLNAMIAYLLDDSSGEPKPAPQKLAEAAQKYPGGREDYIAYCAGCHGREGGGILLSFAPPMDTNAGLRGRSPYNAIAVILRGLPAQRFSRTEARAGMPGFARDLSDARLAQLVNFMRSAWGGAEQEISENQVTDIRKELQDHGYLGREEE